jgi:hypothetical protein
MVMARTQYKENKLYKLKELLALDCDDSGSLSRDEYVVAMARESGLISEESLQILNAQVR